MYIYLGLISCRSEWHYLNPTDLSSVDKTDYTGCITMGTALWSSLGLLCEEFWLCKYLLVWNKQTKRKDYSFRLLVKFVYFRDLRYKVLETGLNLSHFKWSWISLIFLNPTVIWSILHYNGLLNSSEIFLGKKYKINLPVLI